MRGPKRGYYNGCYSREGEERPIGQIERRRRLGRCACVIYIEREGDRETKAPRKMCIYIYIYLGEKKFDPTEKWLEHGMRFFNFFMPVLESTDSETHESAIKKNICVFVPMVVVVA